VVIKNKFEVDGKMTTLNGRNERRAINIPLIHTIALPSMLCEQ